MGKVADRIRSLCNSEQEDILGEINEKRRTIARLTININEYRSLIKAETEELHKLEEEYVKKYTTKH